MAASSHPPGPTSPVAARPWLRCAWERVQTARRRTVQMQTAPTLASTRSVNLRYSKRGGTNGESWTSYAGSSSLRPPSQTLAGARRRSQAHPGRNRGSWSAARGEASSFSDALSPALSPALVLSPPFFLSGFCPCLVNGGSYRLHRAWARELKQGRGTRAAHLFVKYSSNAPPTT